MSFHFRHSLMVAALSGAALMQVAPAALANGCQSSQSSSNICSLGESGRDIQRSSLSNPNITTATLITPGLGPTSARPAFTGLRRESLAGQSGLAAAGAARWNAWLAIGENQVGNSFQPTQSGGNVGLTMLGVDYTFGGGVVAGVAATWDRTRVTAQSLNNGRINASGYNIAPYVSIPLGRNWLIDASIGFGKNDIDVLDNSPNPAPSASGSTTSDRTFTSLALSYAQVSGSMQWSGKINWVTNEDKIAAFTFTPAAVGGPVPASTLRVSQLRAGGQVAFNAGVLVPYVGLTYIYDLQSPQAPTFRGQTPANDKDSLLVSLGVNIASRGAVSGGLLFTSETGRKQFKNDVLLANIAVRF
ncbi:MAG: autotransporter domain-containing protein [Burkholderiales bacterium]